MPSGDTDALRNINMIVKRTFIACAVVFVLCLALSTAQGRELCAWCDGQGKTVCGRCNGAGITTVRLRNGKTQRTVCKGCAGRKLLVCESCAGQGWRNMPPPEPHRLERKNCATCNGRGSVECVQCRNSGYGAGKSGCTVCIGRGWIIVNIITGERKSCESCGGSGVKPCYKCGGSGRTDCRSCNGMGYFEE